MNTPSLWLRIVGPFFAGALLSGSFVTLAAGGPSSLALPMGIVIHAGEIAAKTQQTGAVIQRLRNGAASGDDLSNQQLSDALLDRYDGSENAEDLYEALFWADRQGDAVANSRVVARVVEKYCSQRVVRWHWYCVLGE